MADDEADFCQWLCSLLGKSRDFEILGRAYDGVAAIGLIKSAPPDVVIADIFMPELDGLEVARYLHDHLPDVKVILISTYTGDIYEKMAREEGAIAFIPKSKLSLDALLQALPGEPSP